MTTRWNVQVTERDIENAHKNDSYNCVVAQAVARTIPDATRIEVDVQTIRFTREGQRLTFLTPYAVQGYVVAFDAGDKIQPFSFQLRDARRVARRTKTDKGKAAMNEYNRTRRPTSDARPAKRASDGESVTTAFEQSMKKEVSDHGGPTAPPRVFKKKVRSYGHRLLRINQETE